jgi:hypothetical protein
VRALLDELLASGGLYARLYEEQSGAVPGNALRLALEIEYLRRVPIFAMLDGDQLSSLATRLTTERFESGAPIVRTGDPGDKLYVIASGEVEVLGNDSGAAERTFAILRPGDYFGEIALLYDVPRTATVRARGAVMLHALDRESFITLLEAVPGMRQTVEQAIAAREAARLPAPPSAAVEAARAPADGAVLAERPVRAAANLFAAPWARRRTRLTVVEGDAAGRSFSLNEQFTGIGRHPSNDIVLPDRRVSGFHARIERGADGRYRIADSGSTNGTKLNDKPLTQPSELNDGDVIAVGRTLLRFEVGA